jgi:hypothetical protein
MLYHCRCFIFFIYLSQSFLNSFRTTPFFKINHRRSNELLAKKNWGPPSANPVGGGYSETSSPPKADETGGMTYTVELTKRAGITWGSDLSFRWIYVLDLEQSGEASASGQIAKVLLVTTLSIQNLLLTFIMFYYRSDVGRLYNGFWK